MSGELDWLAKPDATRAHAFKSNGRSYCGKWAASERWVPAGPLVRHCGNCERLAKMEAGRSRG